MRRATGIWSAPAPRWRRTRRRRSSPAAHAAAIPCPGRAAINSPTVRPSRGCTQPGATSASGTRTNARSMRARVRQHRVGGVADHAVDVDQIEVERARRVARAAHAPARRLDRVQAAQQRGRVGRPLQPCDAVDVVGLAGGRDRGGRVPARQRGEAQAGQAAQRLGGGAAGEQRRLAVRPGQVGADRDQDHAPSPGKLLIPVSRLGKLQGSLYAAT